MKYRRNLVRGTVIIMLVWLLPGCGDDEGPAGPTLGELIVHASSQAAPPASSAVQAQPEQPIGDPASMVVGLYSFHISANVDCSGHITVLDTGGTPVVKDFTTNPELFRVDDVPVGTYPCVIVEVSDILQFEPETSGGACVAGTNYVADTYRTGDEDVPFRDLNGVLIPATGSRQAPSEDRVFHFFTTDTMAVIGRGYAPNQTLRLVSSLVVPGATTFYWDATNSVWDVDGVCWMEAGIPAFR